MGSGSGLAGLRAWLEHAPEGTMVPAVAVLEALDGVGAAEPEPQAIVQASPELPWRALFWMVPAETRIGVRELAEALGRPRSWIYRRTSEKAQADGEGPPLPRRKQDGELVFVVGEVRAWLRQVEEVMVAGPMESTAAERRWLGVIEGGG